MANVTTTQASTDDFAAVKTALELVDENKFITAFVGKDGIVHIAAKN